MISYSVSFVYLFIASSARVNKPESIWIELIVFYYETCNVLLTAEDIDDWEVIDLEGCHGPEGDILGGYVTSLVLLLCSSIFGRK